MSQSNLSFKQAGYSSLLPLFIAGLALILLVKPSILSVNQRNIVTPKKTALISSNPESSESAKIQHDQLEKYITVEAALLGVSNNVSLYFQDLKQDVNISIDPSKSWIPASTIKTYVVLEAFHQRDEGILDFNQTVTIAQDNVVPTELETDEFPRLRAGTKATVKQLIEAMVTQSDNTAYNTLLDVLDRRNINNYLRDIGLTETVVGEKLNLDNDQFQQDLQVPGRQPNTTTVKDMATIFELLYNHKLLDAEEILSIFKRQKINNMIPAGLPANTVIAHKTGDWAPIYHDGGVIYKPSDPFILAIFTNSNDPVVLAKLAKVAYYRTSDVVGQNLSESESPNNNLASSQSYYLDESELKNSAVLGVSVQDAKFPEITAADLGITATDLSADKIVAQNIPTALIAPGSVFYGLKRAFESLQISTASKSTDIYLNQAKNRLSEVKTISKNGNLNEISSLLNQSEQDLSQAASIASKDKSSNLGGLETSQVNDLQFATLAQVAQNITPSQKEQFIDMVYNLYQKNQQQVVARIKSSTATSNPLNQKPIIATVQSISGKSAIVKLDDGTTKEVVVNNDIPVRSFNQNSVQSTNSIAPNSKIAIVGQTTSDGKLLPQFILSNVPKELPAAHTGTVIAIDPKDNMMTIQDQFGKKAEVQVTSDTVLKGRDTAVSVGGIKAGSQVSIFGQIENQNSLTPTPGKSATPGITITIQPQSSTNHILISITPSQRISPAISNIPNALSAHPSPGANNLTVPQTSNGQTQPVKVQQSDIPVLKATTVTVIKNSTGANEVVSSHPTQSSKPASNNHPPRSNPVPPINNNQKSTVKKK